jgi:putative ABC transport system ATP-binding protein
VGTRGYSFSRSTTLVLWSVSSGDASTVDSREWAYGLKRTAQEMVGVCVSSTRRMEVFMGFDRGKLAVSATGLEKTYAMGEVEVRALRGIDFHLHQGEFVVLLGPSGSGKSTLLNILGGLDVPTAGSLFYGDYDLSHATEEQLTKYRREHIGFVFQFYNLIPSLTARENVAVVADIATRPMPTDAALAMVGLLQRGDHYPSQLSGGEQQRVAIARAIVKRPEILLCDEPTGALDATTGRLVLEVLDHVNRELRTSTAIVTHNTPIAQMADRVVTLADGRIASEEKNSSRRAPSEVSW